MSDQSKRYPIEGVEVWRNAKNKFVVFQLHYSANPVKRDPEYRDAVRSTMPVAKYNQEYEIVWDSYVGKPVYTDFNKAVHIARKKIDPVMGLPLLRGWDFGLTPACVICQYVEGQLRVIREFTEENMGIEKFSALVVAELKILYPHWSSQKDNYRDYIDPAGFSRKDTDERTCAQYLVAHGMAPLPGPVHWEPRRSAVEHFLTKQNKEGPCFIISGEDAPVTLRGFEGGYRYPESAFEIEQNKIRPLKDEHSHPQDGLQYVAAAMKAWKPRHPSNIPRPGFGFTQPART